MGAAIANPAGPSEAKWENPLQVAARNKRRSGSSGGNIAGLDMGEEEVHQLLADLVSERRLGPCRWLLLPPLPLPVLLPL